MRFPLGFGILTVLILGFICVSPISSLYEETFELGTANTSAADNTNSIIQQQNEQANNDQSTGNNEKRGLGMPNPIVGPGGIPEPGALSEGPVEQVALSHAEPIPIPLPIPITDAGVPVPPGATVIPTGARSFGSDLINTLMPGAFQQSQQSQQPQLAQQIQQQIQQPQQPQQLQQQPQQPIIQTQSQVQELPQVRPEDVPTIIEKNQPVNIPPQSPIDVQQNSQTGITLASPLPQMTPANQTLSTARTFEGWTNCVGAQSSKYGTCKNDVDCKNNKGRADGSCMGGLGVCCVMALTCGDKSLENNTFFANPDFPEPSWEARLCEVELKKKHNKILQIMIEFEEFELAPPNAEGECITDVFQVKLASNRPSPYSLLRICGQNTGQHMYLDVSQVDEPLVLSLATSGGGYPRRWSIRIVQMDEKNYLLAPPGCLQYYTDTVGHFRSFNLGRNLRNLYYAICFRIDNGYSGIRFTENFFGQNGLNCRRRPPGIGGGRLNSTMGAHPHHLVIPPPGYAPPPPRPRLQGQQPLIAPQQFGGQQQLKQGGRFKRMAYSEPVERVQRTHHEHEKEHEKKYEQYPQQPYGAQPYGGQSYGPQPAPYGPPPPPPIVHPPPPGYGYQPEYSQEYKKGEYKQGEYKPMEYKHGEYKPMEYKHGEYKQGEYKEGEKYGQKHEHEHESKGWGSSWRDRMSDTFGWKSGKEENKHDEKAYQQQGYGPQGYGHQVGGYGPPPAYPQQHGGPPGYGGHIHQPYGQQAGYGPQAYGQPPGYGPQAYGQKPGYDYHHKEIDKFGKKYEHLEYKQEKNHMNKEQEKAQGGWWPWGRKEEKNEKKDKYYQHHEALFPMMHIPEMPQCEPRFCGQNDVITFPPSGDSISEMCGNRFNRGRGPKIISGSPLVVYVSNRGHQRGAGFDLNYEQVFYIPRPY